MTSAIEDLLAAGGAGGGDVGRYAMRHGSEGLPDGGEEEHLADGKGCLVVLFLVAEGTRHAAA